MLAGAYHTGMLENGILTKQLAVFTSFGNLYSIFFFKFIGYQYITTNFKTLCLFFFKERGMIQLYIRLYTKIFIFRDGKKNN